MLGTKSAGARYGTGCAGGGLLQPLGPHRSGDHRRREAAIGNGRLPAGVGLPGGGPDPELLPDLPAVSMTRHRYGETLVSPLLRAVAETTAGLDDIDTRHLTDTRHLVVVSGASDGVERVLAATLYLHELPVRVD